ncbi:GrpE protein2, mitochondrial [Sesamum alatum]|uniref:Multifunctional fusion protein n=1 Tax=Sesamum alatum TaxID=300844 RepID=A0AAE2CYX4_9LAMI|nr:GrpE protein2, mitochondrial [Sesamum alatum]
MASSKLQALWNHPAGPKTIHFWAPTFKWGITIANVADFSKPPETLSYPQQLAVAVSGLIWARYSTIVTPKNWNLFGVSVGMSATGIYQLGRKTRQDYYLLSEKHVGEGEARMATKRLFWTAVLAQCRNSPFFSGRHGRNYVSSFTNQSLFPSGPYDKVVTGQVSLLHHSAQNSSAFQWFGFSSSTSPQPNEKETAQSGNEQENKANDEAVDAPDQTEASVSGEKTEPDLESDLSRDDLVKLMAEKEQLLDAKQEELEKMKDKVLRSFAEMENVKERTRRESENAKTFAIQNFAKNLLDVADNLGRASSAARESFSNFDASKDTDGAGQQLKTLLEGVEMTEKQLSEVFKRFGLEKYDPINEEFDPNRHNAVFQVPDASKPADHVAVVLKAGYTLHDRVIRPAEVGVTVTMSN